MSGTTTFTPVRISGDEAWGLLVMSWATKQDFVNGDGTAAYPPPAGTSVQVQGTQLTLDQFNGLVAGSGAKLQFPTGIKYVVFIQDTDETRYIRLPDGKMVLNARNDLKAGGNYQLPPFYNMAPLLARDPQGNPPNYPAFTTAQRLTLQAERVGDYSIGSCA
jgi:hypothetical protein